MLIDVFLIFLQRILSIHTQKSECDSSHHPVSVVVFVIIVVGVNFQSFLTTLEELNRFASNFVWMFLGWTPPKFVKIGVLSHTFYGIIGNFVPFFANS